MLTAPREHVVDDHAPDMLTGREHGTGHPVPVGKEKTLPSACSGRENVRMEARHRKRCKRYDVPFDVHCLTFSCFQRMPLLSRERCCRWMLDALELGRQREMYDLWAYVLMPEHVHLVVWPHGGVWVSDILKTVKQSVSQHALRWLEANEPRFLQRLEDVPPNGRRSFRFQQRGGGYDRNLRTVADIHEKIQYIHDNPLRRGLVDKASSWTWSSCSAWETGKNEPIAIDRDSLPRATLNGFGVAGPARDVQASENMRPNASSPTCSRGVSMAPGNCRMYFYFPVRFAGDAGAELG